MFANGLQPNLQVVWKASEFLGRELAWTLFTDVKAYIDHQNIRLYIPLALTLKQQEVMICANSTHHETFQSADN